MNKKKIIVASVLLIISLGNSLIHTIEPRFSMNDIVLIAYDCKKLLQAAEQEIIAKKIEEKQVFVSQLPSITIQEEVSTEVALTGKSNPAAIFSIDVQQRLFDPTKWGDKKASEASTKSLRADKEHQRNALRAQVEEAFLKLWFVQKKAKLMRLRYDVATRVFKQAEDRYKLGIINKNSYEAASAAYQDELAVIDAYPEELSSAQAALEQLLGIGLKSIVHQHPYPEFEKIEKNGSRRFVPLTSKRLLNDVPLQWNHKKQAYLFPLRVYASDALRYRKDLVKQDYEIDRSYAKLSTARWATAPRLSFFGNYSHSSSSLTWEAGSYQSGTNALSGGLRLSWNVFDGAFTYFEGQRLHALKTKAMLDKDELSWGIKAEVQQAYNELSTAIKNIKRLDQDKIDFLLKKEQWDLGTIARVDFEVALLAWRKAQFDWLDTKVQAALKERALYARCGFPHSSFEV